MRYGGGVLAALALWLASDDVVPPTRLVYVPPQKIAADCPTKLEVEEGVAERIGRSPFSEPADKIVVLTLDDAPSSSPSPSPSLKARVELFDPDLKKVGERDLESGAGCSDLVEAAELAISIALAPSLALGEKPPPPPPPPPPDPKPNAAPLAVEAKPIELAEAPPMPSKLPVGWRLVVGGGFAAIKGSHSV